MSIMQTSANGKNLIKHFEGVRLTSYRDIVGVLTIGVGHTGPDVFDNMTITAQEANDLLGIDLHIAETAISKNVKVPLNQNQFDALVSLVFNIGTGAFKNSTLLRVLNTKDYLHAADQFLVWNKAGGKVVQGLANRRMAEFDLFLKEPQCSV